MRLLKYPEEVQNFYIKQYNIINSYIKDWIDDYLKIKLGTDEIQVSTNVLLTLSRSFNLPEFHRPGDLRIKFDPSSGEVLLSYNLEKLTYSIGYKYSLKFKFFIEEYLDHKPITKELYNAIQSLDHSGYTLSHFYHEVNHRDLDLAKSSLLDYKYAATEDLLTSLYSEEFQVWHTEELFSVFDMIGIIHQSLVELNDTRSILRAYISSPFPTEPMFSVGWRFAIIPDFLLVSYKISRISDHSRLHPLDFNVHIPFFMLRLEVNQL